MGIQKGVVKLQGTVGDFSFYKSVDGFMVRQSSGIDGDRIRNAPEYARTRENMKEFGRAGLASKVLRQAFQSLLANASDGRVSSRLTKLMVAVIKADATSDRGQRNVIDGEVGFLQGFEFNNDANLGSVLNAQYAAIIDRTTGKMTVSIPSFVPAKAVVPPPGATHFQLVAGAAEVDFEAGVYTTGFSPVTDMAVNLNVDTPTTIEATISANSTHPLFLVFGITFGQMVNGKMYALQTGSFNALSLVKVDAPVKPATP
jgi:hypothetical protein